MILQLLSMLIDFINPIIFLFTADFSKEELLFLFKHELIHLKRKDLWYKNLAIIMTSINWFNSVVWIISKVIDLQCEISCDAEVVRNSDDGERQKCICL